MGNSYWLTAAGWECDAPKTEIGEQSFAEYMPFYEHQIFKGNYISEMF